MSFGAVPAGSYTVEASAPGYARATVQVEVGSEPLAAPALSLSVGGVIRLAVEGSEAGGEAWVSVRRGDERGYFARVSVGEEVVIDGLAPRAEYTVRVRAPGYQIFEGTLNSESAPGAAQRVRLVAE